MKYLKNNIIFKLILKSCSHKIKSNCLTCNEGYYLPNYENENKVCLSCNVIEHCSSCFGEKDYALCTKCENGYILKDNQCIKIEEDIPNCVIGLNEKCKACNNNPKLRNQCESCNEGINVKVVMKVIIYQKMGIKLYAKNVILKDV